VDRESGREGIRRALANCCSWRRRRDRGMVSWELRDAELFGRLRDSPSRSLQHACCCEPASDATRTTGGFRARGRRWAVCSPESIFHRCITGGGFACWASKRNAVRSLGHGDPRTGARGTRTVSSRTGSLGSRQTPRSVPGRCGGDARLNERRSELLAWIEPFPFQDVPGRRASSSSARREGERTPCPQCWPADRKGPARRLPRSSAGQRQSTPTSRSPPPTGFKGASGTPWVVRVIAKIEKGLSNNTSAAISCGSPT